MFWIPFCLWFVYKILLIWHSHALIFRHCCNKPHFCSREAESSLRVLTHANTCFSHQHQHRANCRSARPHSYSYSDIILFSLNIRMLNYFWSRDALCEHAVINAAVIMMIISAGSSTTTTNITNMWHGQAGQSSNQYRSRHSRRGLLLKTKPLIMM